MKLISSASYTSRSRGYNYAIARNVISFNRIEEDIYEGLVSGSGPTPYYVTINLKNIRKSKCECPFTQGNRKVCKHMVALYFTAFPDDLETYKTDVVHEQELYEAYLENRENNFLKYISKLKKQELKDLLITLLETGPSWQYDNFYRDYVEYEYEEDDIYLWCVRTK